MKDFELLSHTADLQIRVYGSTLAELFRNALIGMFQSTKPQSSACTYKNDRLICASLPITRAVEITSPEITVLLVDFLSEALYLSDIHNEAYLDVDIQNFTEQSIKAQLKGITIEGFEVVEIKAVTYHNLSINKVNGIWQTDIVFDV